MPVHHFLAENHLGAPTGEIILEDQEPKVKNPPPSKAVVKEMDNLDEFYNKKIDMKDLYDPRSPYSPEEKVKCVTAYAVTGSSRRAAKQTGIPEGTIRYWKTTSSWWPDLIKQVRNEKNEELDGLITGTMHNIMGELEDRVQNGDVVITKDGDQVRKPIDGKGLAVTLAILHDKRALMRGDPTARTEQVSPKQLLEDLKKEFETIAHKEQGVLIEGETIRKEK